MRISTVAVIIAAILIIAGGTWWYTQNNAAGPSTQTTTINNAGGSDYSPTNVLNASSTATTTATTSAAATPKVVTVTYNASTGFSPSSVNLSVGDTVNFIAASGQMWIGSDAHPTHTQYDGTSRTAHCAPDYAGPAPFDECAAGASYSFTFTKAGTFAYHNHLAPQYTGTVVVK